MTYARLDATEARDQAERLARVEADGIRERDRRIAEMKRQTEARQAARAKAAAEQEKAAKALEDTRLADLARAGDVALEQEKAVTPTRVLRSWRIAGRLRTGMAEAEGTH